MKSEGCGVAAEGRNKDEQLCFFLGVSLAYILIICVFSDFV